MRRYGPTVLMSNDSSSTGTGAVGSPPTPKPPLSSSFCSNGRTSSSLKRSRATTLYKDILPAFTAAQVDLAFCFQTPREINNLPLRAFDIMQTNRTHGLDLFFQQGPGPLGHIAENLFLQARACSPKAHDPFFFFYLSNQHLHALIVEIGRA